MTCNGHLSVSEHPTFSFYSSVVGRLKEGISMGILISALK